MILLNAEPVLMPPVRFLIEELSPSPVRISFETPLPIGCGFGVSASCCLTAVFAIARLFGLQMDRHTLGMHAHEAEVRFRTGLGDIAAQLCGGIAYRTCQSHPLEAEQIEVADTSLYYRVFGKLSTASVLNRPDAMERIASSGEKAMTWLGENKHRVDLPRLLERASLFAEESGLLTDFQVRQAIEHAKDLQGAATMIMLGQSVLSTVNFDDPKNWIACEIDRLGTRWIE